MSPQRKDHPGQFVIPGRDSADVGRPKSDEWVDVSPAGTEGCMWEGAIPDLDDKDEPDSE